MRIISKFKDYYDGAAGYGIDKELVYVRKTRVLDKVKALSRYGGVPNCEYYDQKHHKKYEYQQKYIVFCGKLYVLDQLTTTQYAVDDREERSKEISFFASRREADEFFSARVKTRFRGLSWLGVDTDTVTNLSKINWEELHQKHHCPIFRIRLETREEKEEYNVQRNELIVEGDPVLADLSFYRIIDPWTAFQEIAMYMGGVLATSGNDMVQLSDDELHQKHGFDEWTFRTPPSKKR